MNTLEVFTTVMYAACYPSWQQHGQGYHKYIYIYIYTHTHAHIHKHTHTYRNKKLY